MKKNEKKLKNKYGVFNGSTISQETLGVEKSLIIRELDDQDFTIEKTDKEKHDDAMLYVDEQVILNRKRKHPIGKITKWIIISLVCAVIVLIIIFLGIKFGTN